VQQSRTSAPAVVGALRAQAERLCFVTNAWGAEPRARLAQLLLEKSGFEGGRVFFTLGGADANEHAVKFARQVSGKPHGWVITRERSYHGASYAAMALSGDARTSAQADAAAYRVLHVPPPYAYRCPFPAGDDAACGRAAAEHIAAVIDSLATVALRGMGQELAGEESSVAGMQRYRLPARPPAVDGGVAAHHRRQRHARHL
jgi:taurine--2-oxoglutarate transaminase